ncbi:MAG TPA: ABC transporter permease [Firmicutes bacterium]|nr:ABC transporter permease [Bacillota bacterium]
MGKSIFGHTSGTVGLILVVTMIMVAVLAPVLAPHDPAEMKLMNRLKKPMTRTTDGTLYILGSDSLGRDVLSRIIYGTTISLLVGIAGAAISLVIGCVFGLCAGYFGGTVDIILMRLTDIQLAFPFVLLALTILSIIGGGLTALIIVMGIGSWTNYSRVVRAETLSIKTREFVEAARAITNKGSTIMWKHVLPNILGPVIVVTTFNIASNILTEASLSFLGLGVDPSIPSWGTMLAESRDFLREAWWCATFPGLAIMISVLGINLLGDWLRDFLDPKLK